MTRARAASLVPFVEALPLPSRLIAAEHDGRLTVRIRAAVHHPIHLHLDPFQILARRPIRYQIPDSGFGERDLAATVTLERDTNNECDHRIDENERGFKDTVRVNRNEIVEIAVRFSVYSGRYMYHCHILEHEDRDMMRPFVTMPPDLMQFMG